MRAKRRKHPGRPPGAKKRDLPLVAVHPARCPRCGSTHRGKYTESRREGEHAVRLDADGRRYTQKVYRVARCLKCGLVRREVSYEFHGEEVEQLATA